jgi:ADP-heptose:LPS heptosyltransferase
MNILLIPGNNQNAKSYPHWDALIKMLGGHQVKKIEGILKEQEIIDLINWCDVWISIDSFLPHLAKYHGLKRGIVIWGTSDPLLFGYKENVNLLKDRKYLRAQQYKWWKDEPINMDSFVAPEVILQEINTWIQTNSSTY